MTDQLYSQVILDHYRHPYHYGRIKNNDKQKQGFNPICGDKVLLSVKFKNDLIDDIKFQSEGCAISTAAASILLQEVKLKPISFAKSMSQEYLLNKLGIKLSPLRTKCALLVYYTLQTLLDN